MPAAQRNPYVINQRNKAFKLRNYLLVAVQNLAAIFFLTYHVQLLCVETYSKIAEKKAKILNRNILNTSVIIVNMLYQTTAIPLIDWGLRQTLATIS